MFGVCDPFVFSKFATELARVEKRSSWIYRCYTRRVNNGLRIQTVQL